MIYVLCRMNRNCLYHKTKRIIEVCAHFVIRSVHRQRALCVMHPFLDKKKTIKFELVRNLDLESLDKVSG